MTMFKTDLIPLSEVAPSLDLRPLLAYRHLCTQLTGGIVAGDAAVIAEAKVLRDHLERWSEHLCDVVGDDSGYHLVWEIAGATAMGVALDVHEGVSVHVSADRLDRPVWSE